MTRLVAGGIGNGRWFAGALDEVSVFDRVLSSVEIDSLREHGIPQRSEGAIGGERSRFAYFDTQAHPGTIIEISDISGSKGAMFAHIRKAAANWDGSDAIRVVR